MLKYTGDYVEKLAVGSLVVGLFGMNEKAMIAMLVGLFLSVFLCILRTVETRKGGQ
jgi:hypothetical protein